MLRVTATTICQQLTRNALDYAKAETMCLAGAMVGILP
jgi:hypothetical protein